MKPTLSLAYQRDNSERIVFECEHAKTTANHIGGNGNTFRTALVYVLARHTETCQCRPEVIEELWESLAYMWATTEHDLAAADSAAVDPRVLALAHQHLDSMRLHDCPCDPHVITTAKQGLLEFTTCHRDGCREKMKRGRGYRALSATGMTV